MSIVPFSVLLFFLTSAYAEKSGDITSFWLYDVDDGVAVRQLRSNSVISVPYNYTVVAHTAGYPPPGKVTFTRPFRHVERHGPFVLAGDWPQSTTGNPNYKPLKLRQGTYRFSAYPDDDPSRGLTITNVSVYPPTGPNRLNGPLPTEMVPETKEDPLPLPQKPTSCSHVGPMIFALNIVSPPSYYRDGVDIGYNLTWCKESKFRKRLIEYDSTPRRHGGYDIRTEVLWQQIDEMYEAKSQLGDHLSPLHCEEKRVYLEFCASDNGKELCATSPVITLPSKELQEPHLKFRPPLALVLAPGDQASIVAKTSKWIPQDTYDGFWNGEGNENKKYILWGAVERPGGFVNITAPVSGKTVKTAVPLRGGGVTKEDDGTLVYMQFAEAECPTNVDTFRARYATKIIVDENASPLVKQDRRLPKFETPVYPKTTIGDPVEMTVEARNNGGGKRADGSAVELTYQWYLRTDLYEVFSKTYAEPIPGATGKTLKIEKAECDAVSCSRWGCAGAVWYYVDVCNSFGCRRSDAILPDVSPPPGRTLEELGCNIYSF